MELEEALQKVNDNINNKRWPPLSKKASQLVREHYKSQLDIPIEGSDGRVVNKSDTIISHGYNRIVIGDYGAYIEFSKDQAARENIKSKWPGLPKRPVKYLWLETKDTSQTKIYFQKDTVKYADYKPDMLYVSVNDIKLQTTNHQ